MKLIAVACVALTVGCSGWLTPARGAAGAELAACVLEHWGESAEDIAIECSADVVDVLRVQKAAAKGMAKQVAK